MTRFRMTDVEIIAVFGLFLGLVVLWQIGGLGTVAALAAITDIAITRTEAKRARRAAPVPVTPPVTPTVTPPESDA